MPRPHNKVLAATFTGLFFGLLFLQAIVVTPTHADTAIVTLASDSDDGASALATEGGQKLIEDAYGKIIAVFVDSTGKLAATYANSNPSLAGSWATPIKSPPRLVPFSEPAAVLVTQSSLRIIVQGGVGPMSIVDQFVDIDRDASQNIVGIAFGNSTVLDGSGMARHPTATLAQNGDLLAAWNAENGISRVKTFRWRAGVGWTSFNGISMVPDDAIVDSSNDAEIFPSIIERRDNHHVYLIGNREESHSITTLAFNKATFNGFAWSWGPQSLNYESNAARGVSDSTSVTWDPVRNLVVVAYDISGATVYGVFTLDASDKKVHIDTPSLMMTNNEWGSLEVDGATGDYYLFTMNTTTGVNFGMLGYTKRTGVSWNPTLTLVDSDTNNLGISAKKIGSTNSIDLLYTRTISPTTSQLRFVRIAAVPLPQTRPSTLTITASPNPANDTEPVTISGQLTDGMNGTGLQGRIVTVERSLDQSNWIVLAQPVTGVGGSYQAVFAPAAGTYFVRTSFQGELSYASSQSGIVQLTVEAEYPKSFAIVVDDGGMVYRLLDGPSSNLTLIGQPTTNPLRKVSWKPDGSYAIIAGQAATILKYDGNQFIPVQTGLPETVNLISAAWKPDGSYVLISGSGGTVLKYDGAVTSIVPTPTTSTLRSISWRSDGSTALLVGDNGAMLLYENDTLSSMGSGTTSHLYAAAWKPDDQYALVGGFNGSLLRYDGVSTTFINTTGFYNPSHVLRAIGWNLSGNLALISGDTGLVLTYDGSSLSRMPTLTLANLYSLDWSAWWATIVGGQGNVLRFSGASLEPVTSGGRASYRGVDWTEPTAGLDTRPPSQPRNVVAETVEMSSLGLSWDPSDDNVAVAGYEVFRNGAKIAEIAGVLTTYLDTSVSTREAYTYTITASDGEGNISELSDPFSLTILVFNAAEDATIKLATPDNNYGFHTILQADSSPGEEFLLKFDVNGILAGDVTSAKVRLFNANSGPRGGDFYTAPDSWSEVSVTWNNAPPVGTLVASLGTVTAGDWYEVDVSGLFLDNGVVSFRVSSSSVDGADYSSKEGTNPAQLLVIVQNRPPELGGIGDKNIREESVLSFNASASDPDLDKLAFSLGPGAPEGTSITAAGLFSWTPGESQGPGTYLVTFIVSDNGSPPLSDEETISILVGEINQQPDVTVPSNWTVREGSILTFVVSATDPDIPSNSLSLYSTGLPTRAAFDPSTGIFSWTPAMGQQGTYIITFTATDDGSSPLSDSRTVIVTVTPAAIAADFSVSGESTTGKPLLFNATASWGTPPYSYAWDFRDGSSDTGDVASHIYPVKGTYNIMLTVTDSNGLTTSLSKLVTVLPQPLTVTISESTVTAGKPGTFSATTAGGTQPYLLSWNFGDNTSSTGDTVVHVFPVKGLYSVNVTVTDANDASTVITRSITVEPQPLAVSIQFSTTTAGKPVDFTATISGGTTPYSVFWDFGDGYKANGNPATHTYSVKGSYLIEVSIVDANNALFDTSIQASVAAQPLIIDSQCGSATAGRPVFCTSTVSGGTPPYTFLWVFSDGDTAVSESVAHVFAVKGYYTASVEVTDSNSEVATSTIGVVVQPQPLAIDFNISSTNVLTGELVAFTGTASGGTLPFVFAWSFGDGTSEMGSMVFHAYSTARSYVPTLNVADANGASASLARTVLVSPRPLELLSVSAGPTQPVVNSSVTFAASVAGGVPPYTIEWDLDGDSVTETLGNPVTWVYVSPGNVTVKVRATDSNGVNTQYFSFPLSVVPLPPSQFDLDWADYDNDGRVGILDIAQVASCFNHTPYSSDWLNCSYWDLDMTGRVDIIDVAFVAYHFDTTLTQPFPGADQSTGTMDPRWSGMCSTLNIIDRQYCLARLSP